MITNQGKKLLQLCYSQWGSGAPNPPLLMYLASLGGEKYVSSVTSTINLIQGTTTPMITSDGRSTGVGFGNGTGVVSSDDVELFAYLDITGVTTSIQKSFTNENGKTIFSFVITLSNTLSNAVEITEIGYHHPVNYYRNGSSGSTVGGGTVLVDHTMLDSPLVIEPGGQGVIEYKVEINWN